MNRIISAAVLVSLLIVAAGCGGSSRPETFKVSGKVTLNGDPVEGAHVVFIPAPNSSGRTARGTTDSTGAYSLTTFDTNDGAMSGEYTVTISKSEANPVDSQVINLDDPGEAYSQMMTAPPQKVDEKGVLPGIYADPNTSPEKRTVEASPNEFNFDLKS